MNESAEEIQKKDRPNRRRAICLFFKTILHWRYNIKISGLETFDEDKTFLIFPNHQAVIDPIILFSEFYNQKIQPLVDEVYFKNPIFRKILALFDAICVPDLGKNRKGVEQARQLQNLTLQSLRDGKNVLFYPSGHITLNGKESIGNRQLAYNVCRNLPENVTIVCIKTTGLWGSIWSRYKKKKTPSIPLTLLKGVGLILCGKLFTKRRIVEVSIQPMTETLKLWSKEDKISFNKKLEAFYNEL